ncbi:MAG: hypothetical protein E7Z89_08540 [Cyanobacteria bacterium SIG28]|nr:hypothetical protein [Cyanobacteria bacterium SIG28]
MRVSEAKGSLGFQHKIFMDIGASNPKGTLKVLAVTDKGKKILRENSPNSYVNDTVKGFVNAQDFIDKIAKIIKRTQDRILLKDKSGEFPLSEKEKLLSGVAIFVPGTTYALDGKSNGIAFMPNLRDKNDKALTNVDFSEYEQRILTENEDKTGLKVNKEDFKFVVTKDLGGAGAGLAQMMAKKNMLNEGDYVMGVMTGGGFGSVDIKVKNGIVEIETSESSSYIAGNYAAYEKISNIVEETVNAEDPQARLDELKKDNNKKLKNDIQVLGKLGRQGVNVKSHIGTFCSEIGRPDLFKLLQAVGDARIVEMNRLCVSEKDTELLDKLRSLDEEFVEIESTTDGKIAFEMNEDYFGKDVLKNARTTAVNDYANSISLISINKINDCVNKVVLLGPFAHGVNQYVKTHSEDFDGAKDLPELIVKKVKTNIDEQHVDLPSTEKLMGLYNFEVICDNDLNFKDNTVAGDIFLNPKLKFTPNRGSWFNIPLSVLKK